MSSAVQCGLGGKICESALPISNVNVIVLGYLGELYISNVHFEAFIDKVLSAAIVLEAEPWAPPS